MTDQSARQDWMSLLATAPADRIGALAAGLVAAVPHDMLRPPEIGAVMTRGRTGATGAPFNLGEMTVTRCSLRLASGEVGHAYVQGRDRAKAHQAALVDALMQTERAADMRRDILEPLRRARDDARLARAEKAAATRVDFFTLVRGED